MEPGSFTNVHTWWCIERWWLARTPFVFPDLEGWCRKQHLSALLNTQQNMPPCSVAIDENVTKPVASTADIFEMAAAIKGTIHHHFQPHNYTCLWF